MVTITCPRCNSSIPSENINTATSIAKCASCGEVFNFTSQLPAGGVNGSFKLIVDLPKGMTISYPLSDMVITRRWFTPQIIFFIFFTLFWDGILAVIYISTLLQGGALERLLPTGLHAAVGLFLAYYTLAGVLNITEFRVNDRWLTVRHSPIPWFGNKVISSFEIDQLFCAQVVMHNRGGTSITYDVHACMKSGERLKLVSGITVYNQALFIEEQIERRLGITDRPVAGEMEVC